MLVAVPPAAQGAPPRVGQDTAVAAAHGGPAIAFDIPSQPLSSAMEAFALATGLQVLYDRPNGSQPNSPGVHGTLTAEAALQRLLEETGLIARFNGQGDLVLEPPHRASNGVGEPGPPPPDLPRLALDSLRVEGSVVLENRRDQVMGHRLYQETIRATLQQALSADPRTAKGDYAIRLDLAIGPGGAITQAKVAASSGDRRRDLAVLTVVQGVTLEAPPAGLPQPVRIDVHSRHR